MKNKPKIYETIIVEGNSDLRKIKSMFDVDVITTNGSDLTKEKLETIRKVNETKGVILFFDPDYAGEKIRKTITLYLDGCKQCFIEKSDIVANSKKCGVAEASNESIIRQLNNVVTFKEFKSTLSLAEFNSLRIDSKDKRLYLCHELQISYCNNKQLFRRLNMMRINLWQLQEMMSNYANI